MLEKSIESSTDYIDLRTTEMTLTSISPSLTFPLFRFFEPKKFRSYLGVGYFMSLTKTMTVVENTGKVVEENININDLFFRGTAQYMLSSVGLRLSLELHNDFVKYGGKTDSYSNIGYGLGVILAMRLKRDQPKFSGVVFAIHKIAGSDGYLFYIYMPFPIFIGKQS